MGLLDFDRALSAVRHCEQVDIVVQQTDLGNRALGTTSLLTTTWTRPAKRYLNTPGCGLEGYLASAVFTYVIKPAAA